SASGFADSEALAVGPTDIVVGYSSKYVSGVDRGTRAVRWPTSGPQNAVELDSLNFTNVTDGDARAIAVNASGLVVGMSDKFNQSNADVGTRAVRWAAGGTAVTELGTLGTSPTGVGAARALAVNSAGVTVGASDKYANGAYLNERAVRWNANS